MATNTSGAGGWPPAPAAYRQRPAWTGGRIVSVVFGAVLALISIGLLVVGGILMWADQSQRSGSFLTTSSRPLGSGGFAVTSDVVNLGPGSTDWAGSSWLGTVRFRVTPGDPSRPVWLFQAVPPVQPEMSEEEKAAWNGEPPVVKAEIIP